MFKWLATLLGGKTGGDNARNSLNIDPEVQGAIDGLMRDSMRDTQEFEPIRTSDRRLEKYMLQRDISNRGRG